MPGRGQVLVPHFLGHGTIAGAPPENLTGGRRWGPATGGGAWGVLAGIPCDGC